LNNSSNSKKGTYFTVENFQNYGWYKTQKFVQKSSIARSESWTSPSEHTYFP